jgi:hypothetical protein
VGHVISVTKNTISGILIRVISADLHVEKFPTAWTEIDPKSTVIGSTVDCPVCSSSVNWGAVMCRMFGMITLACLLTFSFSGYSKDQIASTSALKDVAAKAKCAFPIVCSHVSELARESALRCRRFSSILGTSICRLLG